MKVTTNINPEALEYVVTYLGDNGIVINFTAHTPGTNEYEFDLEGSPDSATVRTLAKEGLIEYRLQSVDFYDEHDLRNRTKAQVESYIDTNVTDLASAKVYLKELSSVVLYLYKKIMDEV